jgi:hypothetical protein
VNGSNVFGVKRVTMVNDAILFRFGIRAWENWKLAWWSERGGEARSAQCDSPHTACDGLYLGGENNVIAVLFVEARVHKM